jgi:hypothetical protein
MLNTDHNGRRAKKDHVHNLTQLQITQIKVYIQ